MVLVTCLDVDEPIYCWQFQSSQHIQKDPKANHRHNIQRASLVRLTTDRSREPKESFVWIVLLLLLLILLILCYTCISHQALTHHVYFVCCCCLGSSKPPSNRQYLVTTTRSLVACRLPSSRCCRDDDDDDDYIKPTSPLLFDGGR